VLVIVRCIPQGTEDDSLRRLLDASLARGVEPFVEVVDERELERALAAGARLVGVNARDLDTLQVVPGRLEQLASKLPAGVPHVAESGISGAEDAAQLARAGYQLVLVGSALMADDEPQALLREMLEGGRAAATHR